MKKRLTAALALGGLAALDAAAQMPQTQQDIDRLLEQSGFIMRSADTPRKVERMKLLPAHKFVARNAPSGRYYIYTDPDLCICVFVGSEQALSNYKSQVTPVPSSELAPTQTVPQSARSGWVEVQEVDEETFRGPMQEDIYEYRN